MLNNLAAYSHCAFRIQARSIQGNDITAAFGEPQRKHAAATHMFATLLHLRYDCQASLVCSATAPDAPRAWSMSGHTRALYGNTPSRCCPRTCLWPRLAEIVPASSLQLLVIHGAADISPSAPFSTSSRTSHLSSPTSYPVRRASLRLRLGPKAYAAQRKSPFPLAAQMHEVF